MSEVGYGSYGGGNYGGGNYGGGNYGGGSCDGGSYGGFGGGFTSTAGILVLFILLVIISKAFMSY
ncbi:hypothetical protein H9647_11790 [Paenibacillus sp. Sa2BVA9]|uniref:Sporulation protein YjcZ n=1 Tax=Paenibacillus gallinarum TaxID=2762232 RepID=A0ABR8SZ02_9BACL|nr:hypothetical protein [Paenibacillus gallinarum]MBD7968746.1 hypothetical protein [Paenibacillus gallinarum]